MRRSLLLILWLAVTGALPDYAQEKQESPFAGRSVLEPVYGPLAEQIAADFHLADKEGIGIDLGSGPGDLILELCRRTGRMHWISADINPRFFPGFLERARAAGFDGRVSAIYADAASLPFRNDYADIVVSRGSFQFWSSLRDALEEIHRVLKPGGAAFIGRGFPEKLPVETARSIRMQQSKSRSFPEYDPAAAARDLEEAVKALKIRDYRIRIPRPPGAEDVSYGVWLEFRKSSADERPAAAPPAASE